MCGVPLYFIYVHICTTRGYEYCTKHCISAFYYTYMGMLHMSSWFYTRDIRGFTFALTLILHHLDE